MSTQTLMRAIDAYGSACRALGQVEGVDRFYEARARKEKKDAEAVIVGLLSQHMPPTSKPGAYELLQKIASGDALTVAEFRDLGERLSLAPEQIGAAALSFPSDKHVAIPAETAGQLAHVIDLSLPFWEEHDGLVDADEMRVIRDILHIALAN